MRRKEELNKYAVTVVSPPGYAHSAAFAEVSESIYLALISLGYDAILTHELNISYRPIILGANLLSQTDWELPKDAIIYNLEQILPDSPWLSDFYLNLFQHHTLWDYSQVNWQRLVVMGLHHACYVPIGVMPQLQRINLISENEKDIDVLFYGSANERRLKILGELVAHGVNVVHLFGVYGSERDEFISRSKIVLNLHYYDAEIFEIVRISHLLNNRVFIVSEISPVSPEAQELASGLVFASYDKVVEACLYYLKHEDERVAVAQQGYDLIQYYPETEILKTALENSTQLPSQRVRVDIGCGTRKPAGFIGVDSYPGLAVDIVADLTKQFPFPSESIDQLRGYDIIEHLPNQIHTMNEIWRVCKAGAIVDLLVPSSDGRGAFQDPTHVSFWNLNSFYYFTVENLAYFELCQRYGFLGSFSLVHLEQIESPDKVLHVRAILQVVKDNRSKTYENAHLVPQKPLIISVFPDWQADVAETFDALKEALLKLSQHKDAGSIGLVIDTSQPLPPEEQVTHKEFLLEVATFILIDQGIDIDALGIEVCFLNCQDGEIWRQIKSRISYCIRLDRNSRIIELTEAVPTIQSLAVMGLQQETLSLRFGMKPVRTSWLKDHVKDARIQVGDFSFATGTIHWHLSDPNEQIQIGKFCQIAANVTFVTSPYGNTKLISNYPFADILGLLPPELAAPNTAEVKTEVGHDVVIGFGAIILSGITVGHGAIIFSGAVVSQNIPPYSIVGGNPGQVVGYRYDQDKIKELLSLQWWNWPLERILQHYGSSGFIV